MTIASRSPRLFFTSASALSLVCVIPAQTWQPLVPAPRFFHAMTHDLSRNKTVLFGGQDAVVGTKFADTWEFDGQRWTQAVVAASPPARSGHALAFDTVRGRTILFGGHASTVFGDTWEYDGSTWTLRNTATSPKPRTAHALAFDLARGRTVLFGGYVNGPVSDTWEYDGLSWSQIVTASLPPPRYAHALAYDLGRSRTVMFGGQGRGLPLGDTWEYDGVNWSLVATATPPLARLNHGLDFDVARGRTVLFGGSDALFNNLGDTWEYDGVNWTLVNPGGAPPPQLSILAYDFARSRTILFECLTSLTWEYDGTAWNLVAVPPTGRVDHALAYDSARQRTILFGGHDSLVGMLNDTWEFDGNIWTRAVLNPLPPHRSRHALAYDSARRRTVLFGGLGISGDLADTWEYDGINWSQVQPAANPPARSSHSLAYDSRRSRSVLSGGNSSGVLLTDTWEFDGNSWTQVNTGTSPPPGGRLAFDSSRNRIVSFVGSLLAPSETWEYDGVNWTRITTATSPPGRTFCALAYDAWRGRTTLFGGNSGGTTDLADTWEYDGSNWAQVSTPRQPSARENHAMAFDLGRGRIVLFGGTNALNGLLGLNDTFELLPPLAATWTRHASGCTGSVPVLDALPNATPSLGSLFTLRLTALPSQPGAVLLGFGFDLTHWNGTALPLALDPIGLPGCRLWVGVAPGGTVLLSHPGNSLSFTFPIPANTALAGLMVGTQALVFDATAPGGVGTVTNAGIMRIY
jgi:hypothetical protein